MNSGRAVVRALVVDDEKFARQRLVTMLAEFRDVHVIGEAHNGSSAVESIASQRPDLVFLDVQMPGLDGFGVLRCTAGAHRPAVVFVTAHDEFAIRAFEINAIDYLLKPVTSARLAEAVRRSVERLRQVDHDGADAKLDKLLEDVSNTENSDRITIRVDHETLFLKPADIRWVDAQGDLLRVHTVTGVHLVRETMSAMAGRLSALGFERVHRSAIVNVKMVRSVRALPKGDYELALIDGTIVRSGRSYRESVQGLLHASSLRTQRFE